MRGLCFLMGICIMLFGFLFYRGKVHEHIAGYRKMNEVERKGIAVIPLCRNAGTVIMISGFSFLLAGIEEGFLDRFFTWYMVLWFVLTGVDIIYISKSKRFVTETEERKECKK